MHTIKEMDMIAAKLDLLIKKMGEGSQQQIQSPVYAMGSHFTSSLPFMPWVHTSRAKSVAMMETASRPVKTAHTSTTTTGIIHHKEVRGGTSRVHHSREVTTITPILIRTNLP
jgi:hypothetical protein